MTHLAPDELFRYVHGLLDDPEDALSQAHVESCVSCRAAADRLRAEREVIRRACTGSPAPQEEVKKMSSLVATLPLSPAPAFSVPRPGPFSIPMGLTLAASVLGALLAGALFLAPHAPQEPARESDATRLRRSVRSYLAATGDAKRSAKAEILRTGRPAIRILLEERRRVDRAKFLEISDLLLTLKFQGDASRSALGLKRALGEVSERYDEQIPPAGEEPRTYSPSELLGGLAVLVDLGSAKAPQFRLPRPLNLGRDPFYYELVDLAFAEQGLDYAIRFGQLFVTTPDRLWEYPDTRNGAGDPRTLGPLVEALDAAKAEDREAAEQKLLDADAWAIEPLKKAAAGAGPEAKTRISRILDVLEKRLVAPLWSPACRPRTQKILDGEAAKLLGSLEAFHLSSHFPRLPHCGLRLDLVLLQLGEEIESTREAADPARAQHLASAFSCADLVADTRLRPFALVEGGRLDETTVLDTLVVLARLSGLDVCIKAGPKPAVWFDSPENVARIAEEQGRAPK